MPLNQPPDPADDASVTRISRTVRRARGLDLAQYKRGFLLRRLAVRQRALAGIGLGEYADRLAADAAEIDELLRALTINVTEFLRNPTVFRLLETEVLPGLLDRARTAGRPLEVWSAGCASGEEPYSVALLLQRIGADPSEARLLGTDIDREAIAAARAGIYEAQRLREIPPPMQARFFEALPGERSWRIRTALLPPVRFRVHDLQAASLRGSFDLVLCRNVLIYFELELQEAILGRITGALRPRGVLVLGRVERLSGGVRESFEAVDLRERVYRQAAAGASHAS